jgi:hypothetical protein
MMDNGQFDDVTNLLAGIESGTIYTSDRLDEIVSLLRRQAGVWHSEALGAVALKTIVRIGHVENIYNFSFFVHTTYNQDNYVYFDTLEEAVAERARLLSLLGWSEPAEPQSAGPETGGPEPTPKHGRLLDLITGE